MLYVLLCDNHPLNVAYLLCFAWSFRSLQALIAIFFGTYFTKLEHFRLGEQQVL